MSNTQIFLEKFGRKGPMTGVFTDGGASPNPGPGGWGMAYVVDGELLKELHGHSPDTTNNRMELTALIEAYKFIPSDKEIIIYSDSNLCVQTINEWADAWAARGWKRKAGPIKNLDLVRELYDLAKSKPNAKLKWIRSHDGSTWNEYADMLANRWR